MKYKALSVVASTILSSPVFSQDTPSTTPIPRSSVTLFGVVSVGIQHRSGSFDGDVGPGQGFTKISDAFVMERLARNRFGMRGVEHLGDGLAVVFKLDGSFNPGTGVGSSPFWDATSTVGLASTSYGRLEFGRQDNPALTVTLDTDPWIGESIAQTGGWTYSRLPNNAKAGPAGLGDPSAAFKVRNGITYTSPSLAGLTTHLQYGLGENPSVDDQFGWAVKYRSGPWYLGVGFHKWRAGDWSMPMGITYDFGTFKLYGTYTKGKRNVYVDKIGSDPNKWGNNPNVAILGNYSQTSISLGAGVPFGPHLIRMAYVRSKDESPYFGGWDQKIALGYTYSLSKRTGLIANFAEIKYAAEGRGSTRAIELGIRHAF